MSVLLPALEISNLFAVSLLKNGSFSPKLCLPNTKRAIALFRLGWSRQVWPRLSCQQSNISAAFWILVRCARDPYAVTACQA